MKIPFKLKQYINRTNYHVFSLNLEMYDTIYPGKKITYDKQVFKIIIATTYQDLSMYQKLF